MELRARKPDGILDLPGTARSLGACWLAHRPSSRGWSLRQTRRGSERAHTHCHRSISRHRIHHGQRQHDHIDHGRQGGKFSCGQQRLGSGRLAVNQSIRAIRTINQTATESDKPLESGTRSLGIKRKPHTCLLNGPLRDPNALRTPLKTPVLWCGMIHEEARRGVETSQKLGRHRWVVERSFAWLNRFRRLTIRYERRIDIHHAFTALACCIICMRAIGQRF